MKRGKRKYDAWHYRPWGGWIDCHWGLPATKVWTKYGWRR